MKSILKKIYIQRIDIKKWFRKDRFIIYYKINSKVYFKYISEDETLYINTDIIYEIVNNFYLTHEKIKKIVISKLLYHCWVPNNYRITYFNPEY